MAAEAGGPSDAIEAALTDLVAVLTSAGIPYALIGGLATGYRSRPRYTAEGLILIKLFAFRLQDQTDVEALVTANQAALDVDWIKAEWQAVFELDDPRMRWFLGLIAADRN